MYFIKTSNKDKENNIWLEYYNDLTEIDQKLINTIVNKDFDFT